MGREGKGEQRTLKQNLSDRARNHALSFVSFDQIFQYSLTCHVLVLTVAFCLLVQRQKSSDLNEFNWSI